MNTSVTENNCATAVQVYANQPLRFAGIAQALISAVSLFTFIYIYVFKLKKQPLTPIHTNLKVLLYAKAIISAIHALGIIATEGIHEYNRNMNTDNPCDLQWTTLPCVISRSPILITIPSFTLLHAGITFERLAATVFARTYEKMGANLSVAILLIIGLFVSLSSYNVLKDAVWMGRNDYCLLSFVASGPAMQLTYKLVFFLNVPLTCVDILLLVHNRKQLNLIKNKTFSNYTLTEVYQLRENIIATLHVTLPLIICRTFTDSVYLLGQGTSIRAFFATTPLATYTFIQSTYCLICLYTFFAIFIPYYCRLPRKQFSTIRPRSIEEETHAHFEQLNNRFQEAYSRRHLYKMN